MKIKYFSDNPNDLDIIAGQKVNRFFGNVLKDLKRHNYVEEILQSL